MTTSTKRTGTTRQVVESLPEAIREKVEDYRLARKREIERDDYHGKELVRAEWYGYTKALRDAGMITEQERKTLYIYGNV